MTDDPEQRYKDCVRRVLSEMPLCHMPYVFSINNIALFLKDKDPIVNQWLAAFKVKDQIDVDLLAAYFLRAGIRHAYFKNGNGFKYKTCTPDFKAHTYYVPPDMTTLTRVRQTHSDAGERQRLREVAERINKALEFVK